MRFFQARGMEIARPEMENDADIKKLLEQSFNS
jgi:hypothetical protein